MEGRRGREEWRRKGARGGKVNGFACFFTFLGAPVSPSKWVNMNWSGDRATLTFSHLNKEDEGLYTIRVRMGEYYEQYSAYVFVRGKTWRKAEDTTTFKTLRPQSAQTCFGQKSHLKILPLTGILLSSETRRSTKDPHRQQHKGTWLVSVTNRRMLSLVGRSAVSGASPASSFAKLS